MNPETTRESARFERIDEYTVFRPKGTMSLQRAVELLTSGITQAREQKIQDLVIDTTGLTGFPSPTIPERYFFVREWARAAEGVVRIAMIARPEMIDPQKFGITVAANRGLVADVFTDEAEALAWLRNSEKR